MSYICGIKINKIQNLIKLTEKKINVKFSLKIFFGTELFLIFLDPVSKPNSS
jgi:hypothetical protein